MIHITFFFVVWLVVSFFLQMGEQKIEKDFETRHGLLVSKNPLPHSIKIGFFILIFLRDGAVCIRVTFTLKNIFITRVFFSVRVSPASEAVVRNLIRHPNTPIFELGTFNGCGSDAQVFYNRKPVFVPGVVRFKGAKLQMLDLPGIIEGAKDGVDQWMAFEIQLAALVRRKR